MWVVSLLVLHGTWLLCGAHQPYIPHVQAVRHGSLVGEEGEVLVLTDEVVVALNCSYLRSVFDQIRTVEPQLKGLVAQMNAVFHDYARENTSTTMSLKSALQWKIDQIYDKLSGVLRHSRQGTRRRRGLIDVGGEVLGTLFGVATQREVQAVQDNVYVAFSWLDAHEKLLQVTIQNTHKYVRKINEITRGVNRVHSQLAEHMRGIKKIQRIVTIAEVVDVILEQTDYFVSQFNTFLSDLLWAHEDKVTPTLLPFSVLTDLLSRAKVLWNLEPVYEGEWVDFYYPLLEVSIAQDTLLVSIPFNSNFRYTLYNIIPFPSFHKDSLHVAVIYRNLVLLSENLTTVAYPGLEDIRRCRKGINQLRLCHAYLLTFHAIQEDSCELAVIRNSSLVDKCTFVEKKDLMPQHAHLNQAMYIFFPVRERLTVTCQGSNTTTTSALGLYISPDYCTLKSKHLYLLPSRKRFTHYTHTLQHLYKVDWLNVSEEEYVVVNHDIEELPPNNYTVLPLYLRPAFHIPIFSTLSVVVVILLILILGICYSVRSRFAQQRTSN
ncbi:uncharacterized protein [Panulirus ornatus]|uniref:uncharacterized protein n=1 Tax=Panulirus ornatus TaxID=150431 RepID=UPI003A850660